MTISLQSQKCLIGILSQSYFALPHCVKREMSYDHGTVLLLFQNCIIIILLASYLVLFCLYTILLCPRGELNNLIPVLELSCFYLITVLEVSYYHLITILFCSSTFLLCVRGELNNLLTTLEQSYYYLTTVLEVSYYYLITVLYFALPHFSSVSEEK